METLQQAYLYLATHSGSSQNYSAELGTATQDAHFICTSTADLSKRLWTNSLLKIRGRSASKTVLYM